MPVCQAAYGIYTSHKGSTQAISLTRGPGRPLTCCSSLTPCSERYARPHNLELSPWLAVWGDCELRLHQLSCGRTRGLRGSMSSDRHDSTLPILCCGKLVSRETGTGREEEVVGVPKKLPYQACPRLVSRYDRISTTFRTPTPFLFSRQNCPASKQRSTLHTSGNEREKAGIPQQTIKVR